MRTSASHLNKAAAACDELQKQPYFSLDAAEKERITLLRARIENRSQATTLPAGTLIVDHITAGIAGSYFHVFGNRGAVDIVIHREQKLSSNSTRGILLRPVEC